MCGDAIMGGLPRRLPDPRPAMHQHAGDFDDRDTIEHSERCLAIPLILFGQAVGQHPGASGQRRLRHIFRPNFNPGQP